MSVKISSIAERTAKYIFSAAVIASFVFFGWRVMTKGAYVEHEKAQCEAFAVSSALTAAAAVSEDGTLARLVKELGKADFVADHMKMPGNNTISVTIIAEGGDFMIRSNAASGWNSRSPQSAEFNLKLNSDRHISYENEADAKRAERVRSAITGASGSDTAAEHTFTFPHEKPCPAPFTAITAKAEGISKEAIYLLIFKRDK